MGSARRGEGQLNEDQQSFSRLHACGARIGCKLKSVVLNQPNGMSTLGEKLEHELRELIPVTVFFFGTFQLLALTQSLMLEEFGIRVSDFLAATVMALVVAKVILITDHFPLVNRFSHKPLSHNVAWKTAIYFVASLVVRYVEHLIHFWRQTGNFGEANRRLFDEIVWPHFWGIQLWLLILLLVFCTFRELVGALGRERVIAVLFHDRRNADVEREASRL